MIMEEGPKKYDLQKICNVYKHHELEIIRISSEIHLL